jgi:hypothetical protein
MAKQIKLTQHYNFGGAHFETYQDLADYISSVRTPPQAITDLNDAGKIIHDNRIAPDGLSAKEIKTFDSQETYDIWLAARTAMGPSPFAALGWTALSETVEELPE